MLNIKSITGLFQKSTVEETSETTSTAANLVIFGYESAGRQWKLSGFVSGGRLVCGELILDVTPISEFDEITRYWYPTQFTWRNRQIAASKVYEYA